MENNRQAVIDIGSNSVRLLIADCVDGHILAIHKSINTTRLSQGLTISGELSQEAMETTINAVYDYNIKAIEMGTQNVWCFATAAVRNADNAEQFISLVKGRVSVDVDVLSQKLEAQMGFIGVGGQGMRGILDIGGGSTEIAVGDGENIHRCSLDLGAVTALELYPLGNIADELTLEAMQQWTIQIMSNKATDVMLHSEDVDFVGIGGTITTLAAMELQMSRYDPLRIQGKKLSIRTIEKWYNELIKMPYSARKVVIGLEPQRADIIIGGIAILLTFMNLFSLREIRVSDSGNLEGYLKTKLDDKKTDVLIEKDDEKSKQQEEE